MQTNQQEITIPERSPSGSSDASPTLDRALSNGGTVRNAATAVADQQDAAAAGLYEPQGLTSTGVPVFVMLPLDTVSGSRSPESCGAACVPLITRSLK